MTAALLTLAALTVLLVLAVAGAAVLAVLLVAARRETRRRRIEAARHRADAERQREMAGVYHAAVHRLTLDLSEAHAQLDLYRLPDQAAVRDLLDEDGGPL